MHELRQRVDVRALQLLELPPLEDQPRQIVGEREFLEHGDGRRRCLGFDVSLQRRQLQLLEEDSRQLLWRVDVERLTGHLENLRVPVGQLALDVLRLSGEGPRVDPHAGALHCREHRHERPLQIAIDRVEPLGGEHRRQVVGKPQGQIGALACVHERRLRWHVGQANRLRAASAQVFLGERFVAQMLERRRLERVPGPRRVEQVAREHRVEADAFESDPVSREYDGVEFDVVSELFDGRIFEQWLERRQRHRRRELRPVVHALVPQRHIPRPGGPRSNRQSDDARGDGRRRIAEDAKSKLPCRAKLFDKSAELCLGCDQPIVLCRRLRGRREFHHQ